MKKTIFVSMLLLLLTAVCMAQTPDYTFNPNLSPIKYGVEFFTEEGHGSHRAVVEVKEPSRAVLAHIEWRRHDTDPDSKGIVVENAQGQVVNSASFNVTDMTGDVVFQADTPGKYYIYYMPFYPTHSYFIEKSEYFSPVSKADKGWLSNNALDGDTVDLSGFPKAEQIEIQSKDDFNSFYPMEVPASDEEIAQMTKNITTPYMVFAEDRLFQIRMKKNVPYKWYKSGEVTSFTGTAQPNEIYTFQIGVYALKDIEGLTISASDFGSIKAGQIHCINTGGKDYLGRPFTKTIDVKKGYIQPLWFYVQMPKDPAGSYEGTITLKSKNNPDRALNVKIDIKGDVLEDGGVSDLWRMSRLAWLDSDLGINDDLVKPYTPIKVSGNKASVLNRDYYFDKFGFPSQLTSNNNKILSKPISYTVYINNKPMEFKLNDSKVLVQNQGAYEFENTLSCGSLDLIIHGRLEFDGVLEYKVLLKANENVKIDNVVLSTPLNSKIAKYGMGLGMRGGLAPDSYYYEWNPNRVDYAVWLGDYDAGVQIYLKAADDQYRIGGKVDADVFSKGWYNDNKGTGILKRDKNIYLSEFYSGEKNLKAGETCNYNFRVTVTPFKPLDNRYYSYRVGNASDKNSNIFHLHHATGPNPYINYPFIRYEELRNFTNSIKGLPKGLAKSVDYDVEGLITGQKGSITLWCSSNFDWPQEVNKSFLDIYFDTTEMFNFYWNRDCQTFRCVMWEDVPNTINYSYDFGMAPWKKDEIHKVTISWGDKFIVYVDDELKGECPFAGIGHDIPKKLTLSSDFSYYGIQMSSEPLSSDFDIHNPSLNENAVLFDTFTKYDEKGFIPAKGPKGIWTGSKPTITKEGELTKVNLMSEDDFKDMDINLYYTCRELSNHCYEIWALRSLGDEIYDTQTLMYTGEGAKLVSSDGGGYQWLNEHLQFDYIPGWHCNLGEDHCAAIATKYVSRWMNYYVNGMDYIMKTLGIHGLYLDGIGYDRETMKRIARVMEANNPDYRINFHAGNNYDFLDGKCNTYNMCLEHFAYLNSLWTGEMYDFDNTKPEYWFVEMSGIPFGLRNEILDYKTGGNPWRGMVFAMCGRGMPVNDDLFTMWDETDIMGRKMIGYWDKKPVVKTNNPLVYATAYTKKGSVLICVGSWDKASVVDLTVDYKACGINPNKCTIKTVPIKGLQEERELSSLKGIEIPEAGGIMIMIENK